MKPSNFKRILQNFTKSLRWLGGKCKALKSYLKSKVGKAKDVEAFNGAKESLLGSSHCDFCGKTLKWFENIPVLGYFFVRGKCSKCKKRLSFQYPLVEFCLGLLFLAVGFKTGFIMSVSVSLWTSVSTVYFLMVVFLLSVTFLWDLKYMIIPNKIVLSGIIATTIFYFLGLSIQKNTNKKASLLTSLGVFLGVGLLLYFKYLNFFIE